MKKYSDGKKYKVIAYCISRFHRDEQSENIYHFCKWCGRYGYKVVIFSTLTDLYFDDLNDHGEKQIYSLFDVSAFDAVVIMSETFKKLRVDREIADRAIAAGVPVISVNRRLEGCINVDFTYRETFEKIVRHIVEDHGCRTVNYIGGDTESKFSRERFECYRKVLEENGIPFEKERCGYGNFVRDTAIKVLNGFLQTGELPEAIICANDTMAMGVCSRLKEIGIRVPEDIKVTGFDGIEFEQYHNPRITTAAYNWERTASVICQTIEKVLEGQAVDELIIIPYNFQPGHSCGCQENYVINATERLLEYEELRNSIAEYYQTMTNMNAKSGNCEDFRDVLKEMEAAASRVAYKEYWICLNTFCWDKISNRIPEDLDEVLNQVKNGMEEVFSDRIVIAYHSIYGQEGREQTVTAVDREALLPELDRVLEEEERVMFIPLHLQGITIGYFALTFDDKSTRLDILNVFMMNIRRLIEEFWGKVLKEQLFSKDDLTGLYNRRGFMKQKQKLFEKQKCQKHFTLLSLDIDNLKKINNQYGYAEGDEVLCQTARIIESVIKEDEICARLVADSFVIVSTDARGRERAHEIEGAIHDKLRSYNMLSGKAYEIWLSMGSHSGENVEQFDYEEFASHADREMYRDKQRNREI